MEKHIYGDPKASKVLLQLTDSLEGLERGTEYIKNDYGDGFCLMALMVNDWDSDLSPWEAPPVFGDRAFAGKAKDTLAAVLEEIRDKDRDYYIGGYSLAGLFALWSVYQSDAFKGAACASPSVWFPDFSD
ncbi:MAG: hypothetical protein IKE38_03465, partial [Erysipelotrichaceae bacterium]|nr:hypothetical protein [Erysipelotrichaceae bacterium]